MGEQHGGKPKRYRITRLESEPVEIKDGERVVAVVSMDKGRVKIEQQPDSIDNPPAPPIESP